MRTATLAAVTLPLLVTVAAGFRLIGLSSGLRHPLHVDELPFVEFTADMLRSGSLDHRYYEYPGLLFYLLAPVLALWDPPYGPEAYLALRAVCAAFGVASVALAYRLGACMSGRVTAAAAALLLAVSPAEIRVAHTIRPDVVLEMFVLLSMLTLHRMGAGIRGNALAGAAVAAAAAVKFSGVLLLPSLLAQRFLQPGRRARGLLVASAAAAATFALASPYTLVNARKAWQDAFYQFSWHYRWSEQEDASYAVGLMECLEVLTYAFGAPALALAAFGAWTWRHEWRQWLFLAAFPATMALVFATSDVRRIRFFVPMLGVVALFAGRGVQAAAGRSRALAALLLVAGAALPASESIRYVRDASRPQPRDRALDWIDAHLPGGSRVLVTEAAAVGVDPGRFEVLHAFRLDGGTFRLALHVDLVVASHGDDRLLARRLEERARFRPFGPYNGRAVRLLTPPDVIRGWYRPIEPAAVWPRSSGAGSGTRSAAADAWLEVELARPMRVARLELFSPTRAEHDCVEPPRAWEARAAPDMLWQPVEYLPGRPNLDRQFGERSHVLIAADPIPVSALRVLPHCEGHWSASDLRLDEEIDRDAGLDLEEELDVF